MSPKLYATPVISATDELDKLEKVIYLFSCFRKINGETSKVLRRKLIILLALYMKYGVTNKTKDKAALVLKTDRSAINSNTMELRNLNYLVKDTMNIRINYLHDDLSTLRDYVEDGSKKLLFLYTIKDET